MIEFYLNVYRHSVFYLLVTKITGPIMRLWQGSFFRRMLFENWGLGFTRRLSFKRLERYADESVLIGFAVKVYDRLMAIAGRICAGSMLLRLIFGFFGSDDLQKYRGIWLVLVTIMLIPILPTWYILGLCILNVALFGFRFIIGKAEICFDTSDFFIALFAAILIISVPISYIPSNSIMMGSVYILFILFCFVVKNTVNTREKLFAVISAILLAGLAVAGLGILQKLTGRSFVETEAWIDQTMFASNTARVYSTLDNPNVLGEYLIFISLLSFAALYYFKNWFYKLVSLGIFAAAMLCLVYTLSRGAWLGVIFAFALFAVIKDKRLIWLGLAALPFIPFIMPDALLDRLLSIGNLQDSSSAYRFYIWQASLNMIKDYWLIGIGLGTRVFVYIYQKFAFTAVYAPHSHNLFLQLIIDLGISGILMFFGIIFMMFRGYLSRLRLTKDSFHIACGAAICAAMGGYLLQGVTDNVWYNYRVVAFFWVIVALSGALSRLMLNEKAEKENENEEV